MLCWSGGLSSVSRTAGVKVVVDETGASTLTHAHSTSVTHLTPACLPFTNVVPCQQPTVQQQQQQVQLPRPMVLFYALPYPTAHSRGKSWTSMYPAVCTSSSSSSRKECSSRSRGVPVLHLLCSLCMAASGSQVRVTFKSLSTLS